MRSAAPSRSSGEWSIAIPEIAEDKRIIFGVGVNLGDVIAEGGDIYGDGVNIAARLEGLAEPGGLCISRTVRDHIGDRLPVRAFIDILGNRVSRTSLSRSIPTQ